MRGRFLSDTTVGHPPFFLKKTENRTNYSKCTLRYEIKCSDASSIHNARLQVQSICRLDSSTGSTKWQHRRRVRTLAWRYRLGWLRRRIGSTFRGYRSTAGTTLFVICCIRDGVGNGNSVRDFITSELKGLPRSIKMTTVQLQSV